MQSQPQVGIRVPFDEQPSMGDREGGLRRLAPVALVGDRRRRVPATRETEDGARGDRGTDEHFDSDRVSRERVLGPPASSCPPPGTLW